jgi:hypothetical protein
MSYLSRSRKESGLSRKKEKEESEHGSEQQRDAESS